MTNKQFVVIREGKTHGYYHTDTEAIEEASKYAKKYNAAVQVAKLLGEVTYEARTTFVPAEQPDYEILTDPVVSNA